MATDTHGVDGEGWYAFDLDGTLATYDTWKGIDHIGESLSSPWSSSSRRCTARAGASKS